MSAPPLPEVFGNYAIRGIQEVLPPEPVSWWPATPGWLLLAIAVLAWLAGWGWRRWRRWLRDRYRREALARLATPINDPAAALQATAIILKATALAAFPRRDVASLSGSDWLQWLESSGASFSNASRTLLAEHQYRPPARIDPTAIERLVAETRAWVRNHEAQNQ